jgi:hypothetical protein
VAAVSPAPATADNRPGETPAPIQRAAATEFVPAADNEADKEESGDSSPAAEQLTNEDYRQMARKVYPLIRRMLAIERERLSGRGF